MSIFYITGNESKFKEAKLILPEVEQLSLDLPEIQEIDPHHIIEAKINQAKEHKQGNFLVEDSGLYLSCLNGFPGPLVKWLLKAVGSEGIFSIADNFKNYSAEAKLVVGYSDQQGIVHFFEGSLKGTLVKPRGDNGFGWDPIFLPDGQSKTFAEMTIDEKNVISHRRLALNQLKDFLER